MKRTPFKTMLDIGAGNNLLSKFFQLKSWVVHAVEPSIDASKYLKAFNINIYNSSIEDFNFGQIKDLSFINVQFVLEHLRNPIQFLKNAYNALVTGGVIRICVPNDFSDGHLAYMDYHGGKPAWVAFPDHINYINFDSLNRLLERIGFEEVYRRSNFPLEFLLLGGIDFYSNKKDKEKVSPFVSNFESALKGEKLYKLYECLAQVGFGRSAFMYFRKN
ncbi:MAG: class I SAM-dependent methyltransferase [Halanaerobiaceae bacterium]|nr:class I SAM-dependent methyltransferase [Halanaerobiaceae bacterium]